MRHISMQMHRAGFSLLRYFVFALFACPISSVLPVGIAQENPAYEVASIHLSNPNSNHLLGFYSYPGGRVTWGFETLRDLLSYAFNIPPVLIRGGPSWINETRFDIQAIAPPKYQEPQSGLIVNPNDMQRLMLQNLLHQRFGLRVQHISQSKSVLILKFRKPSANLRPTSDPGHDPHGGILVTVDGAVTGRAFGENMTMALLAEDLAEHLEYPVVDETHLKGGYDFHLPAVENDNQDMQHGIGLVLDRLGLTLQRGKRPIDTVFVENATLPTPN